MANYTRRSYKLMRELSQMRVVMMEGVALSNYRARLLHNFNEHVTSDELEQDVPANECHHMITYKKGTREVTNLQFFDEYNNLVEESSDGELISGRDPKEDEERVLVLEMVGPVTRCGGWCSYGSMDFRDLMLQYASDEKTKGLVLVTDTPGGSAFALHDFKQGMDAWNAAGKNSIQYIDGMDASAGVACGSQCQKVIAYNGKDPIGCVGAMMAGWVVADGTTDLNGYRYLDITAEQTPQKNLMFRQAAEGDYKALQEDVNRCCQEFLDLLSDVRPQIPEEQKKGLLYDAKDVIGTFIDGIGTYDQAIHYALTGEVTWDETPSASTTPATHGEDGQVCNPDKKKDEHPNCPDCDPEDPDCDPEEDPDCDPEEDPNENSQTSNDMTQSEINNIAINLGMTVEQVMAAMQAPQTPQAANTAEDEVEANAPAEPQEEEPATAAPEPAEQEETPAPNESEPEAQEEEPEAPAAAVEEQEEAPANPVAEQEEEPAAAEPQSEEPAPEAENQLESIRQMMTEQLSAMQQQMTAMQQQFASQLAASAEQAEAYRRQADEARAEAEALRGSAPAPAIPAAPADGKEQSNSAPGFKPGMTARQIIEEQKRINATRRLKK